MAPRGYLPELATWKAHTNSTRHGALPGPAFAPGCTHGPPACHAAESTREGRGPSRKVVCSAKKEYFINGHISPWVSHGAPINLAWNFCDASQEPQ